MMNVNTVISFKERCSIQYLWADSFRLLLKAPMSEFWVVVSFELSVAETGRKELIAGLMCAGRFTLYVEYFAIS